ncbi:MAG: D-alanyl-D-alanine carboxypeptidase/D-alanyl-D-alanine-endopeptidase [Planctomycetes bacterium]|nr:D-alanyl-D-alanine carboxypeptidase/D-alanyl-D-alanine-endopeptidase [Planctomycetota bacterium]
MRSAVNPLRLLPPPSPRARKIVALALAPTLLAAAAGWARADDAPLRADLEAALAAPALAKATVGLSVVRLPEGAPVFERGAEAPLIPASNLKLLTSAAALETLGADYQHVTRVVAEEPADENGALPGDLLLVGAGDPNLSARWYPGESGCPPLDRLAGQVAAAGVKSVAGGVVGVDRLFDEGMVHPDWPADQRDKWYEAPVAALSINDACADLTVRPGPAPGTPAVVTSAPEGWVTSVKNACVTTAKKGEHKPIVELRGREARARGAVWTGSAGVTAAIPVADPALAAADAFTAALRRKGVTVTGTARSLRVPPAAGAPTGVREYAAVASPLCWSLRTANRNSQNLYAETLARLTAASRAGAAGGPVSFAAGAEATTAFLTAKGLDVAGVVIRDGSGLSKKNRASARLFTRLLAAMNRAEAPTRNAYFDSLAVSGVAGTLDRRLDSPPTIGMVLGKTGTVNGVSALSGYVVTGGEARFAFSVLMNDLPADAGPAREAQDRVALAICQHALREAAPLAAAPARFDDALRALGLATEVSDAAILASPFSARDWPSALDLVADRAAARGDFVTCDRYTSWLESRLRAADRERLLADNHRALGPWRLARRLP